MKEKAHFYEPFGINFYARWCIMDVKLNSVTVSILKLLLIKISIENKEPKITNSGSSSHAVHHPPNRQGF